MNWVGLTAILDWVKQAKKEVRQKRTVAVSVPARTVPGASNGAFDLQLRSSVARLRESLANVLDAVGANVRVPHSITRDFGVDKSLSAKLARVVREPDPYAAALNVPGDEAMRIFSRTMRDAGAPIETLTALRNSVDSFQDMVRTHCDGDRATLEMLAASALPGSKPSIKQQQQLETFRRNMFRGASAIFGVQARVQLAADFLSPTRGDDSRYDVTLLNGLVDLRRIRSDVTWAVSSMRTIQADGQPGELAPFEPVDPDCRIEHGEAPLLRDFCSSPIPDLRVTDTADRVRRFELPEGPVGSTSAVTLFTGWTYRSASARLSTPEEPIREHFVSLNTPVETVIQDLFMHKDLLFARHSTVQLYSQLPGGVSYPNGPRDRGMLPLFEQIRDLSGSPVHPATPDVSQYTRIIQYTIERLGFSLNDFHGVRVQLNYPPIPSMLMYRYSLPEA